jgi:hypothetical protein
MVNGEKIHATPDNIISKTHHAMSMQAAHSVARRGWCWWFKGYFRVSERYGQPRGTITTVVHWPLLLMSPIQHPHHSSTLLFTT